MQAQVWGPCCKDLAARKESGTHLWLRDSRGPGISESRVRTQRRGWERHVALPLPCAHSQGCTATGARPACIRGQGLQAASPQQTRESHPAHTASCPASGDSNWEAGERPRPQRQLLEGPALQQA